MKNIVIIDIDTERNDQITIIGKPEEFPQPNNQEEAFKMLDDDILTICEGLVSLINISSQNGYKSASQVLKDCIKYMEDNIKIDNK